MVIACCRLRSCCCVFPLAKGCIAWAAISIILGASALSAVIIEPIPTSESAKAQYWLSANIAMNGLLIHGAVARNSRIVFMYVLYFTLQTVVMLVVFIYFAFKGFVVLASAILIALILQIYINMVVNSLHTELDEEEEEEEISRVTPIVLAEMEKRDKNK